MNEVKSSKLWTVAAKKVKFEALLPHKVLLDYDLPGHKALHCHHIA